MPNQKEYPRTKEGSKIAKIVVDRDLCISAQSCIPPAEAALKLDEESKVIVTDANAVEDDALIAAAQACPTKAILLFDAEDNQIN